MRAGIAIVVLGVAIIAKVAGSARAQAGAPLDRYVLSARLDVVTHRVEGHASIRWTNRSSAPVRELCFHTYLNAFDLRGSRLWRESGGRLRGIPLKRPGGIEIASLRVDGVESVARLEHELEPADRTRVRLPLAAPIEPGRSVTLEARFVSRLPPLSLRAGWWGSFHVVAQWFPKLGVLDPSGRWICHPYHALGEFHADFASYELRTDVPAEYVVAASGERVQSRVQGDRRLEHWTLSPARDVMFVAWDRFVERTERHGDVRVRVLHPPGWQLAAERHLEVARAALDRFGALFGPYPYPVLSIVVPPRGAEGAAGMEYPALVMTAGLPWPVPGVRAGMLEEVTAHEIAHQWFPMTVGSDEVEHPMLDEGLAQWATADLLRRYPRPDRGALDLGPLRVGPFEVLRAWAMRARTGPPPLAPAHAFQPWQYGRTVYARAALALESVRRVWGAERFERALGGYARRHRFALVVPHRLWEAFDATHGAGFSARSLRPIFEDGQLVDRRLQAVETTGRRLRVVLRRVEGPRWPDEVEVLWGDGRRERWAWPDDRDAWTLEVPQRAPVRRVQIDPDRRVLIDPSRRDDVWTAPAPRPRGALGIATSSVQALLGALGP